MAQKITLTLQGLEKLKKELEFLKKEKRVQVAERIRIAKDYGDLSENAEYHEAKEEQAFVEGRILEIEQTLKMGHIVHTKQVSEIGVGTTVHLLKDGKDMTFEIVGTTEADPAQGKISIDSPLAQALLGKTQGDIIELSTPAGIIIYTIKDGK